MKNRTKKQVARAFKKLDDAQAILQKEIDTLSEEYKRTEYYGVLIDNLLHMRSKIGEIQNDYFFLNEK